METTVVVGTTKGKALIILLHTHLDTLISPPTTTGEQRVTDGQPPAPQHERMEFQRVTDSPAIKKARDPTAKRNLVQTSRTHRHQTRNNTPGNVPAIQQCPDRIPANDVNPTQPQQSPRITQEERTPPNVTFTTMPTKGHPKRARLISQIAMAAAMIATASATPMIIPPYPVPRGIRANAKLISQHALNALTMKEALYSPPIFAQRNYVPHNFVENVPYYAHYMSPMVHPSTGETI
jgi:hypothetical protein